MIKLNYRNGLLVNVTHSRNIQVTWASTMTVNRLKEALAFVPSSHRQNACGHKIIFLYDSMCLNIPNSGMDTNLVVEISCKVKLKHVNKNKAAAYP